MSLISILFTLSTVFLAATIKAGIDMLHKQQLTWMWGYFSVGLIPLAITLIIWSRHEATDTMSKTILLGVIGAALGASGLIWVGKLVEGPNSKSAPISAVTEPVMKDAADGNAPSTSIGSINGNNGIITQGQRGNNSK